ncbi:hypothetical protein J1N35_031495 [Gossypium stocksii]|uniref:Uncharacterized protein n=1 Tax=Gossypium stocksii TaxID=47602 RepID=A0A9D3V1W0_9ROSI|nr:hypothetical protein J1N35_031495 [Gossypium stocksii]
MDIESRSFFIDMGSLRKSAFFEGCQIPEQLTLVSDFQWDHQEYARQLQQGQELQTHVALLMAAITTITVSAERVREQFDTPFNPITCIYAHA